MKSMRSAVPVSTTMPPCNRLLFVGIKSSQLILALERIRHGGTLVILLHKIEALDTMELLYLFSQFSDIEVFKPLRKHAIRSTFYLIAKNVQPSVESARVAVIAWKKAWWNATFGGEQGVGAQRLDKDDKYAQAIIDSFGNSLLRLLDQSGRFRQTL